MSSSSNDIFHKMLLPEVSQAADLEQFSRDRLPNIFPIELFEIVHTREKDKGIDVTMDLKSNGRYPGIKFLIQLKATNKKKPKRDGSYSQQIDKSNINFLLNHKELSIYVLYVKLTDTFYFEWVDEFYQSLSLRDGWESKQSHTLSFSKILNEDVGKEIYNYVLSDGERYRMGRERTLLDGEVQKIVNSFHDHAGKKKHPIEAIEFLMDSFEGLQVLPNHILIKLPPFSEKANSQTYYSEKYKDLKTDSIELFNLFNNIIRNEQGKLRLKQRDDQLERLPDWETRLKEILRFFHDNLIHHLSPTENTKIKAEWVHIHQLSTASNCNCEKCSYYKLDIKRAIKVSRKNIKITGKWEELRRAYVHEELGEFEKAFDLYSELAKVYRKKRKFVSYFICKYNLHKLKHLVNYYYFGPHRNKLLIDLEKIDLDIILSDLQKSFDLKDEIVTVLKWIVNGHSIHNLSQKIDQLHEEISKIYSDDQRGGWISADKYPDLSHHLSQLSVFVEGNLFLSTHFYGFERSINKGIDCVLMLYCLQNEQAKKIAHIEYYIARLIIFYGNYDRFIHLAKEYKIQLLKFEDSEPDKLHDLLDNFLNSLDSVKEFIEVEKTNHFFSERINEVLSNILLVLRYLDISPETRNKYFKVVLLKASDHPYVHSQTISRLLEAIVNSNNIAIETFLVAYRLGVTNKKFARYRFATTLPHCIKFKLP